jgi:hypothetical protein
MATGIANKSVAAATRLVQFAIQRAPLLVWGKPHPPQPYHIASEEQAQMRAGLNRLIGSGTLGMTSRGSLNNVVDRIGIAV